MIAPQSTPVFRMSQGIICSSPSLTITPYVTDAWSFNTPKETVTRQNIYDEDTGEIKYVQETPMFRLKLCGEQANLGVTFVGKYASICEGIEVAIPPNQVIPHRHKLK